MWLKTIKGLKLINSILFNKEKSICFPLITFVSPLFLCVLQHLISLSSHCRHRRMSALSPPSPSPLFLSLPSPCLHHKPIHRWCRLIPFSPSLQLLSTSNLVPIKFNLEQPHKVIINNT